MRSSPRWRGTGRASASAGSAGTASHRRRWASTRRVRRSGKTTTLNALSRFIPEDERIVTIEDTAELQLQQRHVVKFETRPPNLNKEGGINQRQLLRTALRMRPDRIIVGECRGAEALDMLQAMNTGVEGSMSTLHANTPRDGLHRLETLVMMSGIELPSKAIRQQMASAIDVIV